jgi:acetate---CoA ligase (ADP-forming)
MTSQALQAMLEARRIALVGASPRPGSFGQRMTDQVARSPAGPVIHLVNPRYSAIGDRPCYPSLADLPDPVDLVLLGVPDAALEQQLALAASRGDGAAVIFGNAHEDATPSSASLRDRLASTARAAGMQLCGAGCMGFVNVARGLRAIGYVEPDPLPAGPIALITHSGSVFSALLRTRRAIGFTLAVSAGQELVTTAAAYLDYALTLPETKVVALVLEAMREPARLQAALARAAARDIPVVLLTVGGSAAGRAMVAAHSGALAGRDGGWEALARAYGVHRAGDLAELTDTLELFAAGRRASRGTGGRRTGIATVHDSGLERAHTADVAEQAGVAFAEISEATKARLAGLLDAGLEPANPLDVWGTGSDTEELFAGSLAALAGDSAVLAVALAVDLVTEFDGDDSYQAAVRAAAARTSKPVAVLSNLAGAIDQDTAADLRRDGIPVLEGTRSGLLALRHLLDHAAGPPGGVLPGDTRPGDTRPGGRHPGHSQPQADEGRRHRAGALLDASLNGGPVGSAAVLGLLREYGITAARSTPASDLDEVLAAAAAIGFPVVLKTAEPAILHKTEARGVILGVAGPAELAAAYQDLSARLGPRALVCQTIPAGPELALGITRDPDLGPLIVVGAGGVLVELLADRAVALPPVDAATAARLIGSVRAGRLLAGVRGAPPADLAAVIGAVTGLSALAAELGDRIEALDLNPLICGPAGAVAVDALLIPRAS